MASIYKKDNKIYISWYDSFEEKKYSKSLGLNYTPENLKKAEVFKKEFESELSARKEKIQQLGIVKNKLIIAMDHFLRNNSNKASGTIREYNWFFEKFNKTFDPQDACSNINKLNCESWLNSLRTTTYQQNTLFKLSKVLKKFLSFLFEYNYIQMFKLNKDTVFRRASKPIIIFSDEDLITLIKGLKNKNSNFRTTFYLLLYTGLRPSDIYELKTSDINFKESILSYYSPKTNEYFRVPIHMDLTPILKIRADEVGSGNLLEYESINNIGKAYRRYLKQLKLNNKGYTLRTFRKTFISLAHASGMDLATVSKLAGHKQITTTQTYYNQLNLIKQSQELTKLQFPK